MKVIKSEKLPGMLRNRPMKDLSGERFGRLVAVSLVERDKDRNHKWLFRCDCGAEKVIRVNLVKQGRTSSCGCLFQEMMVERNTKHGLSRGNPKEYRSWKDMRARCKNPNDSDFANYGGRGIKVCPEWEDFAAFLSDMGSRPDGFTLDRIDVNGDYSADNCRWASAPTQARNKRNNNNIKIGGITKTLTEWCREYGIERSKVRYRLAHGWSVEEAFKNDDFRKRNGDHRTTA